MKKIYKVFALLLACLFILSSCGSKSTDEMAVSESMAMNNVYMAETPTMSMGTTKSAMKSSNGGNNSSSVSSALANRKIVYTANLTLETKEYEKALSAIYAVIDSYDAYISNQEEYNSSLYEQTNRRSTNITVRVPVENFDSFVDGVSVYCNVTNKSINSNDITDSYYDTEIHLTTLKTEETTLLGLLEKATDLKDVISLESALSDIRYQIETLEAQIRRYDSQISYSTVYIYLDEVVEYTDTSRQLSFSERVASAFKRSGQNIKNFFQNIILWIIRELPVLILKIALVLGLVKIVYVLIKKVLERRKKKEEDEE